MAALQYYDIIQEPVVTEKSMRLMANKEYTFYVHPESNKAQIKDAVQRMFEGTKVVRVNTMNYPGKPKRRGTTQGRTPARKKAIVKLSEDSKEIELYSGL